MPKPKPIPSASDILAAFRAAEDGKGRRLAELVKGFSVDDLATAFGHVRLNVVNDHGLHRALSFAAGMREQRARQAASLREWRKEQRAEQRSKA